jgi:hypothetical protein
MKRILTKTLTFISVQALDASQLEVRFCDCRRKTDHSKCGQSREKSGCFNWSSSIALSSSVNESCRTDSSPITARGTDLHKVAKCFSAVELSVCSVRGGGAVASLVQRASLSKQRLRRVRWLSLPNTCKQTQRLRPLGNPSAVEQGCFVGGCN